MNSFFCVLFVAALSTVKWTLSELRQERATVDYWNPKYLSDVHTITKRTRRGGAYTSNFTCYNLQPWSNNVTMRVGVATRPFKNSIYLQYKGCDFFQQSWGVAFIKTFADFDPVCPIPVGHHGFYNVELPPKHFPLPLPNQDVLLSVELKLSHTGEIIMKASILLKTI